MGLLEIVAMNMMRGAERWRKRSADPGIHFSNIRARAHKPTPSPLERKRKRHAASRREMAELSRRKNWGLA